MKKEKIGEVLMVLWLYTEALSKKELSTYLLIIITAKTKLSCLECSIGVT